MHQQKCTICGKSISLADDIVIDCRLESVLESTKDDDVESIVVKRDGSWHVVRDRSMKREIDDEDEDKNENEETSVERKRARCV